MQPISISLLTVCGLEELAQHGQRNVSHVLSILDPDHPEPEAFSAYAPHQRTVLRFHDAIEPAPGIVLPEPGHVEAVLAFGQTLAEESQARGDAEGHLLVHCHAGISRSTAALLTLLAQVYPDRDEDSLITRLTEVRPQAWPNSRMIGFADEFLGRDGRLLAAVARLYARQLAAKPFVGDFMTANGRSREVEMAARASGGIEARRSA